MAPYPGDNLGPNSCEGIMPYKYSEVLQDNAGLSGIFDQTRVRSRHCFKEGNDRGWRRDLINRICNGKGRKLEAGWLYRPSPDRQCSITEAVFLIKPQKEFVH